MYGSTDQLLVGTSTIKEQLGAGGYSDDDVSVDVKAAVVGDPEAAGLHSESEEDFIPFLEDSELETQQLIESNRLRRQVKSSSGVTTSSLLFVLTILSLLGLLLVADTVFDSSGQSTAGVFESSGDVIITTATSNSTAALR